MILKNRSPSCGLTDAKIYPPGNRVPCLERGGGLPTMQAIFTDVAGKLEYYSMQSVFMAPDCVILVVQSLEALCRLQQ